MKIQRKKTAIILAVISVLLLSAGYVLNPIVRYSLHNNLAFQRIPDGRSHDIPLSYAGRLCGQCTMGG